MTRVCPECFGDAGLKKRIVEIRSGFPNEKCSFHPNRKGVPIAEVAAIVDPVFRGHYGIGEYNSYAGSQEGDDLETVVAELVRAEDDNISRALVNQLIEDDEYWPPDGGDAFYADDQCYVEYQSGVAQHSILWRNFRDSILHRQRFFNAEAKRLIAEIFNGLHMQLDCQERPPVYELVPGSEGSTIFRARVAEDADRQAILDNPIEQLGAPPEKKRRAGRMNAAGVCAFYGAFDLATCMAELRPVVGSQIVCGQFNLRRSIYVLDMTRFQEPIKPMSVFVKSYIQKNEQWLFMSDFMYEISQPIAPKDEHLDYIPTQAVAEYFLHHHEFKRGGKPVRIEAIIYRSAQHKSGRNIVLLGDAGKVLRAGAPSSSIKSSPYDDLFSKDTSAFLSDKWSLPNPSLQLNLDSVKTYVVQGAQYDATEAFVDIGACSRI